MVNGNNELVGYVLPTEVTKRKKPEKEGRVRLTEEAHGLCAEIAHDCDITMKDVASEAITRMSVRKRDDKRYAFGMFAMGAIAGGVLMFMIGAMI